MVQWLRLGAFTARARALSLVGELRSCKLCGMAKKEKEIRDALFRPKFGPNYQIKGSSIHTEFSFAIGKILNILLE